MSSNSSSSSNRKLDKRKIRSRSRNKERDEEKYLINNADELNNNNTRSNIIFNLLREKK
jgi:hypothetical protein